MDETSIPKRIFFWTLFVLFWLVSATIIGYSFGYRFSLKKGIFIYGGSITLKTTPHTVDIYLNDTLISSKNFRILNNAHHINGIQPGEYLLEVKSPEYQSWSKKISVHSGISTEFWNIVLTENYPSQTNYDITDIEKLFISPRKNLAAITSQINNDFIVKILNLETSEISQLLSLKNYVFTDDEKENIEWSPQAHRLIIPTLENRTKKYLVVTRDTQEILNLNNIIQDDNLSNVRWDPKSKDVVFYILNHSLWRLDLNSPQDKKIISEHIASYDFSPNGLFYMRLPEGIIYKTNFDGSSPSTQITTSAPDNMQDNSYQIIIYDESRITFLNKSRELYIYNKGANESYFKNLSRNAYGSQFSDDGKKLLYWTDNEIFTYFVRPWDVQPIRSENENMSITRLSDPIHHVQWSADYEHTIFTTGNKVKLIEIDNRDHRNMMDILSLNDNIGNTGGSILKNNPSNGKIYFTDKNETKKNILCFIDFPKQASFFQNLFLPNNSTATTEQ